MSKTITYTFGNSLGSINVVTGDNPQSVNTQNGTYPGYAITSVSGTFNGQQVTGLYGASATYQRFGTAQIDNAIFGSSTQGYGGSSLNGIDTLGIYFGLADGRYINIYQDNPGSTQLLAGISSSPTVFQGTIYAPVASTNYASVVCFSSGTLIRTSSGDVAVEDLQVGDMAVTAAGEHRLIQWIGHRTINPHRHPRPSEAQPVRIRAHALGENRPARDLVVSPGHAIALDLLGDVLIPAGALVNGATIIQEDVDTVTYWHIELDSHDLLIAEGQPAESYMDMGNRSFFARRSGEVAPVHLTAGPDAASIDRTHADFCRPFHGEGSIVEAVRLQLRCRAQALGWRLIDPVAWRGTHLEVDGRVVHPELDGTSAQFALPASARDVFLVSPARAPSHVSDSLDTRVLGVCLASLTLEGSAGLRSVALDDWRLSAGWHRFEGSHRWTAGRARLPADLWAGFAGMVTLQMAEAGSTLPRWVAPGTTRGREMTAMRPIPITSLAA